jgi:hypothetical protein
LLPLFCSVCHEGKIFFRQDLMSYIEVNIKTYKDLRLPDDTLEGGDAEKHLKKILDKFQSVYILYVASATYKLRKGEA